MAFFRGNEGKLTKGWKGVGWALAKRCFRPLSHLSRWDKSFLILHLRLARFLSLFETLPVCSSVCRQYRFADALQFTALVGGRQDRGVTGGGPVTLIGKQNQIAADLAEPTGVEVTIRRPGVGS